MKKYFTILSISLSALAIVIAGMLYAAWGPLGYTLCATEGAICTLNGSTDLAYGANSTFSYRTVANGTTSITCNNATFWGDPLFGITKACYKKIVVANLPWLNSQGTTVTEGQNDGFLILAGQTKQVDNVHGDCKNITAPTLKNVYVPTKTLWEWTAFKTNAPTNLWVTLTNCSGPINGTCTTPPTFCSAGTKISDNNNTTPGQNRLWICQWSGWGSNSPQCSYTNPGASCNNNGIQDNGETGVDCGGGSCGACGPSCTPNGSYTYGSCSVSCWGGTQDRYDSCGDYYDTVNTNCNPTACNTPSNNCTTPWWTTVTDGTLVTAYQNSNVTFGSSCVSQTATCNNGTLNLTYTYQNCTVDPAPSYTYTLTWSAWSDCSGASCPGIQSRTPTCKRDQDNVVVDASTYCGVQNSDLTQPCTGHEKTGMPACASFPNKDVCAPDTYQCTSLGWANLWDGYCKNRNEVLCVSP